MKLKSLSIALATLGTGLAATSAHALLLMPGTGPLPVDIIASAPGGTVLASQSVPITTDHWTGTFRNAVVDSDPGAGVRLDFYYQVTNASTSTDSLGRLTGSEFGSNFAPVDLVQTSSAFSIFTAGTQAAASGDRGPLGVVGFNFFPSASGGKVDPGETSYILIVRTNATSYVADGKTAITNGTAITVNSYMPTGVGAPPIVGPIPEPGTLALLASGLLAAGGVARRRTK